MTLKQKKTVVLKAELIVPPLVFVEKKRLPSEEKIETVLPVGFADGWKKQNSGNI